jgi:hypothetical protein
MLIEGCADGTTPPCAGTTLVSLAATIVGTPFDEVGGNKDSTAELSGVLELAMASRDPAGCYTTVGRLDAGVRRGPNVKHAFAMDVSALFCPGGVIGTFEVDASGTQLATFRDAVGTGTFVVSHGLDPLTSSDSLFSIDLVGQIELVR